MGLFQGDDAIIMTSLGASGAFDSSKKTSSSKIVGAALGASIASGKAMSFGDIAKMNAMIKTSNAWKK